MPVVALELAARAGRRRASCGRRRARDRGRRRAARRAGRCLSSGVTGDERVVDLGAVLVPRSLHAHVGGVRRVAVGRARRRAPSKRGREEHRLAVVRDAAEDPVDLRLEAHVEHPVGLVEDEDADVGERDSAGARAGRRADPAWRRGCGRPAPSAPARRSRRRRTRSATRSRLRLGERPEVGGDLGRELAGGDEDEGAGAAGRAGGALDERQAEGERLARAGRRLGEDVEPGERVGEHERPGWGRADGCPGGREPGRRAR